jgi:hypothetical protein
MESYWIAQQYRRQEVEKSLQLSKFPVVGIKGPRNHCGTSATCEPTGFEPLDINSGMRLLMQTERVITMKEVLDLLLAWITYFYLGEFKPGGRKPSRYPFYKFVAMYFLANVARIPLPECFSVPSKLSQPLSFSQLSRLLTTCLRTHLTTASPGRNNIHRLPGPITLLSEWNVFLNPRRYSDRERGVINRHARLFKRYYELCRSLGKSPAIPKGREAWMKVVDADPLKDTRSDFIDWLRETNRALNGAIAALKNRKTGPSVHHGHFDSTEK